MAKAGAPEENVVSVPRGKATIQDKIAAFVMLDSMPEGTTQAEKTMRLSLSGFTNAEIAEMLQTTSATVATNLSEERKRFGDKRPRGRGAKAKTIEIET